MQRGAPLGAMTPTIIVSRNLNESQTSFETGKHGLNGGRENLNVVKAA